MKLFNVRKVMVLVSVSIHEAIVSSTFFSGLKASRRWKLKKIDYFGKYKVKRTESCIFENSFQRALLWQSLGGLDFFILHTYPWYLQKVGLLRATFLKNSSGWSSPKGSKNCFRNAPINYWQTMPDDRCTLVKMNITRSRNHDTNDTSTNEY